jgi:hypothetical protein
MNNRFYNLIVLLICLSIISCGKKEDTKPVTNNPATDTTKPKQITKDSVPVPDPKEEAKRIEAAAQNISGFLKAYSMGDNRNLTDLDRTFIFDSYDLNNDGKYEYLVGLTGTYYCGTGGCTMVILNTDFKLNSEIAGIVYPIFVSNSEINNGWKNIYVASSGSYHIMKYNGAKYPANPADEPEFDILKDSSRREILKDKIGRRRSF